MGSRGQSPHSPDAIDLGITALMPSLLKLPVGPRDHRGDPTTRR